MDQSLSRSPLLPLLDGEAGKARYHQIREWLRRAILEGRLARGSALPSSRVLAADLGCARGTVLQAYEQLLAEGYLETRPGSRTRVAQDLPDELLFAPKADRPQAQAPRPLPIARRALRVMASHRAPGPQLPERAAFRLGWPALDAFPFPLFAGFLDAEWRRAGTSQAVLDDPFGAMRLRRAIADYLRTARGFVAEPEAILITSGIRQAFGLIARLLLDPGERAWVEEPGFRGALEALAAAGVEGVPVPVDGQGLSVERGQQRAPDARLAIVTPAHHYPLGLVTSLPRRIELLLWAERAQGWIVEDDYDGEYRYAGRPLTPLRALDDKGRVAYVGSFSKVLFPALRLGYLVLPDAVVEPARALMAASGPATSPLGQTALARFIQDGHFVAHLRKTRRLYAERQAATLAAIQDLLAPGLVATPHQGGMHLLARPTDPCTDDRQLARAAAGLGVRTAPLSEQFAIRGQGPERQGLLLGYAAHPPEAIREAVAKLRPLFPQTSRTRSLFIS